MAGVTRKKGRSIKGEIGATGYRFREMENENILGKGGVEGRQKKRK